MDLIYPAAWTKEHNNLHHRFTQDVRDPDVVELLTSQLDCLPLPIRAVFILVGVVTWRIVHYVLELAYVDLHYDRMVRDNISYQNISLGKRLSPRVLMRAIKHIIPYVLFGCTIMFPCALQWGWTNMAIKLIVAETITGAHSYSTIVTNHSGSDVYQFELDSSDPTWSPPRQSPEFILCQIVGSVDYYLFSPTFLQDLQALLTGDLGHQIEHHIYESASPAFYTRLAPRLRRICTKYGVPYICEPLHVRVWKTLSSSLGLGRKQRIIRYSDIRAKARL
jgi:fatty acid desaturase